MESQFFNLQPWSRVRCSAGRWQRREEQPIALTASQPKLWDGHTVSHTRAMLHGAAQAPWYQHPQMSARPTVLFACAQGGLTGRTGLHCDPALKAAVVGCKQGCWWKCRGTRGEGGSCPTLCPPTSLAVLPLALKGGEGAAWGRGVQGAVAVV